VRSSIVGVRYDIVFVVRIAGVGEIFVRKICNVILGAVDPFEPF
jgi:hypothetical protein